MSEQTDLGDPVPDDLPLLGEAPNGEIDALAPFPDSFLADADVLRRLGRRGHYRAVGGTLVELRFPSAQYIAEIEDAGDFFNPDRRRLRIVYREEIDENSAERVLG